MASNYEDFLHSYSAEIDRLFTTGLVEHTPLSFAQLGIAVDECNLEDALSFSPSLFDAQHKLYILYQCFVFINNCRQKHFVNLPPLRCSDFIIDPYLFLNLKQSTIQQSIYCYHNHSNIFVNKLVSSDVNCKTKSTTYLSQCTSSYQCINHLLKLSYGEVLALWLHKRILNFHYLLYLNHRSGRSFDTPNYYPIIPWVSDFSVKHGGWRDLSKSKFRLNKSDEQLNATYGNHVLNDENFSISHPHHVTELLSDVVLSAYKCRQTAKDILTSTYRKIWQPNEYPSSMVTMYHWSPVECIPDLYTNPKMFVSIHDDLRDLSIPEYCDSNEDFCDYHLSLLESDHVSNHLHEWIDLNFGVNLIGKDAIEAMNVYLQNVDNHRYLINYGMVALFTAPHPPRFPTPTEVKDHSPIEPLKRVETISRFLISMQIPLDDKFFNRPSFTRFNDKNSSGLMKTSGSDGSRFVRGCQFLNERTLMFCLCIEILFHTKILGQSRMSSTFDERFILCLRSFSSLFRFSQFLNADDNNNNNNNNRSHDYSTFISLQPFLESISDQYSILLNDNLIDRFGCEGHLLLERSIAEKCDGEEFCPKPVFPSFLVELFRLNASIHLLNVAIDSCYAESVTGDENEKVDTTLSTPAADVDNSGDVTNDWKRAQKYSNLRKKQLTMLIDFVRNVLVKVDEEYCQLAGRSLAEYFSRRFAGWRTVLCTLPRELLPTAPRSLLIALLSHQDVAPQVNRHLQSVLDALERPPANQQVLQLFELTFFSTLTDAVGLHDCLEHIVPALLDAATLFTVIEQPDLRLEIERSNRVVRFDADDLRHEATNTLKHLSKAIGVALTSVHLIEPLLLRLTHLSSSTSSASPMTSPRPDSDQILIDDPMMLRGGGGGGGGSSGVNGCAEMIRAEKRARACCQLIVDLSRPFGDTLLEAEVLSYCRGVLEDSSTSLGYSLLLASHAISHCSTSFISRLCINTDGLMAGIKSLLDDGRNFKRRVDSKQLFLLLDVLTACRRRGGKDNLRNSIIVHLLLTQVFRNGDNALPSYRSDVLVDALVVLMRDVLDRRFIAIELQRDDHLKTVLQTAMTKLNSGNLLDTDAAGEMLHQSSPSPSTSRLISTNSFTNVDASSGVESLRYRQESVSPISNRVKEIGRPSYNNIYDDNNRHIHKDDDALMMMMFSNGIDDCVTMPLGITHHQLPHLQKMLQKQASANNIVQTAKAMKR